MGKDRVITLLVAHRILIWIQCQMSKDRFVASLVMCDLSATIQEEGNVRLSGGTQKDGNIDEDVNHRIKVNWLNWSQASGVFCDPWVS
jgi:hypothetical protein